MIVMWLVRLVLLRWQRSHWRALFWFFVIAAVIAIWRLPVDTGHRVDWARVGPDMAFIACNLFGLHGAWRRGWPDD